MSLPKILTQIRPFTSSTYHVKARPTDLQLTVVDGGVDSQLVEFYMRTVVGEDPTVIAAGLTQSAGLRECVREGLGSQLTVQLTDSQSGGVLGAASGGTLTEDTLARLRTHAESGVLEEQCGRLVRVWLAAVSESSALRMPVVWHVSGLAVAPNMRRLGLARFMLAQHGHLASRRGCSAITLLSTTEPAALTLHKAEFKSLEGESLGSHMDPWLPKPHPNIQLFYKLLLSTKNYDTWLL